MISRSEVAIYIDREGRLQDERRLPENEALRIAWDHFINALRENVRRCREEYGKLEAQVLCELERRGDGKGH